MGNVAFSGISFIPGKMSNILWNFIKGIFYREVSYKILSLIISLLYYKQFVVPSVNCMFKIYIYVFCLYIQCLDKILNMHYIFLLQFLVIKKMKILCKFIYESCLIFFSVHLQIYYLKFKCLCVLSSYE